ncbi:MAG: hypothetical protein V4587_05325 [Acidobacteriota bacterium]
MNAFWALLICGTAFAFTPMLAQAAPQQVSPPSGRPNSMQQPPSPPKSRDEWSMQHAVSGPYRLTYSLTETDGGKRLGSQRYVVVLDADASFTNLKLGTKVPIATKQLGANAPSGQFEWTFIDIGLRIDAKLRQFANGLELETHVSQSALDSQEPNTKDPVVRQTDLDTSVLLNEDKPLVLGTLDTPESTHRLEIQVELTKIP